MGDSLAPELPLEICELIFAHLTSVDLCSCSAVCKRWHQASQQGQLWLALAEADYGGEISASMASTLTEKAVTERPLHAVRGGKQGLTAANGGPATVDDGRQGEVPSSPPPLKALYGMLRRTKAAWMTGGVAPKMHKLRQARSDGSIEPSPLVDLATDGGWMVTGASIFVKEEVATVLEVWDLGKQPARMEWRIKREKSSCLRCLKLVQVPGRPLCIGLASSRQVAKSLDELAAVQLQIVTAQTDGMVRVWRVLNGQFEPMATLAWNVSTSQLDRWSAEHILPPVRDLSIHKGKVFATYADGAARRWILPPVNPTEPKANNAPTASGEAGAARVAMMEGGGQPHGGPGNTHGNANAGEAHGTAHGGAHVGAHGVAPRSPATIDTSALEAIYEGLGGERCGCVAVNEDELLFLGTISPFYSRRLQGAVGKIYCIRNRECIARVLSTEGLRKVVAVANGFVTLDTLDQLKVWQPRVSCNVYGTFAPTHTMSASVLYNDSAAIVDFTYSSFLRRMVLAVGNLELPDHVEVWDLERQAVDMQQALPAHLSAVSVSACWRWAAVACRTGNIVLLDFMQPLPLDLAPAPLARGNGVSNSSGYGRRTRSRGKELEVENNGGGSEGVEISVPKQDGTGELRKIRRRDGNA